METAGSDEQWMLSNNCPSPSSIGGCSRGGVRNGRQPGLKSGRHRALSAGGARQVPTLRSRQFVWREQRGGELSSVERKSATTMHGTSTVPRARCHVPFGMRKKVLIQAKEQIYGP